jgi:hypothetical protein
MGRSIPTRMRERVQKLALQALRQPLQRQRRPQKIAVHACVGTTVEPTSGASLRRAGCRSAPGVPVRSLITFTTEAFHATTQAGHPSRPDERPPASAGRRAGASDRSSSISSSILRLWTPPASSASFARLTQMDWPRQLAGSPRRRRSARPTPCYGSASALQQAMPRPATARDGDDGDSGSRSRSLPMPPKTIVNDVARCSSPPSLFGRANRDAKR